MKKSEILAPAGDKAMILAGLAAGADAFYLASDDFGARAYAENFTIENIKESIDLIHLFGKKVFVTMNTLIKDSEMQKALTYAMKLYEYGTDALIIQDLGFFTLIKDKLGQMDFHASTQMAVRDYYGAKALMDLGFDRIVIARETPISELAKISKLPVEKEVFVHGSLCVSYSGECLMSSYFGARSANRGRCAGICRKKYKLVSDGKILADDYFLSMKDLNVIDRLDSLLDLGIDCLKIEGRMKTPEYVYSVVKNYRSKIDENTYDKNDLRDVSNRGYTQGFIFSQTRDNVILENDDNHRIVGQVKGSNQGKYFIANSKLTKKDNLSITTDKGKVLPFTTTRSYKKGDKIFLDKYKDAQLGSNILLLNSPRISQSLKEGLKTYKNLGVDLAFRGYVGESPELSLSHGGVSIRTSLDFKIEEAKNISIDQDDIRESLSKFGNDIFEPRKILIDIGPGIFIKKKDLNSLRRKASDLLKEKILRSYHRKKVLVDLPSYEPKGNFPKEINVEVKAAGLDVNDLKSFDNVYIDKFDKTYQGLSLYLNLNPHIDYEVTDLINFCKENQIKGLILNSYRDLAFLKDFQEAGLKLRIGRYLNVFNSHSLAFYSKFAEKICVSVESDFSSINSYEGKFPVEALAFGRIELMNMRHCPFSVIKKCGLVGCETCKFRDGELINEDNKRMIIKRNIDHSIIYPKKPSRVDPGKFAGGVSILGSVFSNSDIKDFKNAKSFDNLNYDRGVI
ncbi:MAG: U32 family peptidase [Anaerococcus sp.]|nr:U32 family peptidase [Anaerococcus sp.]